MINYLTSYEEMFLNKNAYLPSIKKVDSKRFLPFLCGCIDGIFIYSLMYIFTTKNPTMETLSFLIHFFCLPPMCIIFFSIIFMYHGLLCSEKFRKEFWEIEERYG